MRRPEVALVNNTGRLGYPAVDFCTKTMAEVPVAAKSHTPAPSQIHRKASHPPPRV